MNAPHFALMGSPIALVITAVIALIFAKVLYSSKHEFLKKLSKAKRFGIGLLALALVVFLQVQVTFPQPAKHLARFDAPVATQPSPEKITAPVDNVTKAKDAFAEQLKKSKEANAQ